MVRKMIAGMDGLHFDVGQVMLARLEAPPEDKRYNQFDQMQGLSDEAALEKKMRWKVLVNFTGSHQDWISVFASKSESEARDYLDNKILSYLS